MEKNAENAIVYRRAVALTNIPVNGYYKFGDRFQIIPNTDASAPKPSAMLNHHPFFLEFQVERDPAQLLDTEKAERPEWVRISNDARKTSNQILLLLTVFTNFHVFTYSGNHQSWFAPLDLKSSRSRVARFIEKLRGTRRSNSKVLWGQEFYSYDEFEPIISGYTESEVDPMAVTNANTYFNTYGRRLGAEFELPDNIGYLLDMYYSLDSENQSAFLSSCSLFNQGLKLWAQHPSLSFAALVSSLETLIHADHKGEDVEVCNECQQQRHRVSRKFVDFLRTYGSSSKEFPKYARKIYNVRCKILHTGQLFIADMDSGSFDMDENEFRRTIIRTCRICLINWLCSNGKTVKGVFSQRGNKFKIGSK